MEFDVKNLKELEIIGGLKSPIIVDDLIKFYHTYPSVKRIKLMDNTFSLRKNHRLSKVNLEELILHDCFLNFQVFKSIIETFSGHNFLKKIDLSNNSITGLSIIINCKIYNLS